MNLNDKMIRKRIIKHLQNYKNCRIFEEVTVPSGKARADIVAINGHVTAYEIKSDEDTFYRLPSQIQEYEKYFEKNYVIVGKKYSKKIDNHVPKHWGIIIVSGEDDEHLNIEFYRVATLNPNVTIFSLLFFLTSNQVKYLANETPNINKRFKKSQIQKMIKQEVIALIKDCISKNKEVIIRKTVRETLKGNDIKTIYKNGLLIKG
jgi:hypothetical protein